MPRTSAVTSHRPPVGDQLAATHQPRLCGRVGELARFRETLLSTVARVSVFHVYGIGGVGKSALLREFRTVAQQAGVTTVLLDGRLVDPSPGGFLLALTDALGLSLAHNPTARIAELERFVLLLDACELLAPLDAWLRETFLPQLTTRVVVVLAGRAAPSAEWTADLAWAPFVTTMPLGNLGPDESRLLLAGRGVPEQHQRDIVEFTHGHPLALVLVADAATKLRADQTFSPTQAPQVLRTLLDRMVASAPSAAHRHALELCAHVRVTNEALLAALVESGDPHELFEWLRSLSFVEHSPEGIFPHDIVREVLDADFRWRDPESYSDMHRRVFAYLRDRLRNSAGRARQRAFFDKLYLHRFNPTGARYHEYGTLGTIYSEPATERDHVAIRAAIGRHEGEMSANISGHWLRRQPDAFRIIRGVGGGLLGYVASLVLREPSGDDEESDPAIRAAWEWIRRYGPLRSGEEVVHHRFHGGTDVYQAPSPAINLLAAAVTIAPVQNPKLASSLIAFADAAPWVPIMEYINFQRASEADFSVGGHRYAVYAHDWRIETFDSWWQHEAERAIAAGDVFEPAVVQRPTSFVVLSEHGFAEAVRQGLRDYHDTSALAGNPLLRSRMMFDATGREPNAADLQALLRGSVEGVNTSERNAKFYRALWHTYIQPAVSQERVAERLGLPFSTYRYHLARGTEQIVELLWRRELHGDTSGAGV